MENKEITIAYLQEYLKKKDHNPGHETDYVLKLFEEVGELSRAIYRDTRAAADDDFRGSVEEELWDVMYYVLCLANLYDIDMEKWIKIKEDYNNKAEELFDIIDNHSGESTVTVMLKEEQQMKPLGRQFGVAVSEELLTEMKQLLGEGKVIVKEAKLSMR